MLRINYAKAFFFALIMAVSLVGLLLLKYFKRLRVALFYSSLLPSEISNATHIYVYGSDKNESICNICECSFEGVKKWVFVFKHLRYEYHS